MGSGPNCESEEARLEWLRGEAGLRHFEAFVIASSDALYRMAYFTTRDAAETEDLLQETFVRVAAHWGRVRSDQSRLAYARKVLFNLALDGAARRARRREELMASEHGLDQWPDGAAARMLVGVDDAAALALAFHALSRQQRAVLFLRYWEDLSEPETAEVLGCSLGTVKKTAWRAVARLRGNLARHPGAVPVPHGPLGRPRSEDGASA